jgi:hypothetical protein
MSSIRAVHIVFLHFLAISHISGVRGICVSKNSQWRYALENSAYDSSLAENYPTCFFRCHSNSSRCKSLTYDLATKMCEISVESRWSKPWAYKKKTNSIYMEMLGVAEILSNATQPPTTQATTIQGTTSAGKKKHLLDLYPFGSEVILRIVCLDIGILLSNKSFDPNNKNLPFHDSRKLIPIKYLYFPLSSSLCFIFVRII